MHNVPPRQLSPLLLARLPLYCISAARGRVVCCPSIVALASMHVSTTVSVASASEYGDNLDS